MYVLKVHIYFFICKYITLKIPAIESVKPDVFERTKYSLHSIRKASTAPNVI